MIKIGCGCSVGLHLGRWSKFKSFLSETEETGRVAGAVITEHIHKGDLLAYFFLICALSGDVTVFVTNTVGMHVDVFVVHHNLCVKSILWAV